MYEQHRKFQQEIDEAMWGVQRAQKIMLFVVFPITAVVAVTVLTLVTLGLSKYLAS